MENLYKTNSFINSFKSYAYMWILYKAQTSQTKIIEVGYSDKRGEEKKFWELKTGFQPNH